MNINETLAGLKYIADSPPPEHGGFHPQTVEIVKAALAEISELRAALKIATNQLPEPQQLPDFTDYPISSSPVGTTK